MSYNMEKCIIIMLISTFHTDQTWRSVLSYGLYPKVYRDFCKNREQYGYIMRLGSHVFFHGLTIGETNQVNVADGNTLVIKYLGLGEVDKEGMRTVSFELNGIRREVKVPDPEAQKHIVKVPMADPENKSEIGASIPGAVAQIYVKVGDEQTTPEVAFLALGNITAWISTRKSLR